MQRETGIKFNMLTYSPISILSLYAEGDTQCIYAE